MAQRYLLSITARNRPGVLAVVTNALAELGGNILELKQNLISNYLNLLASVDFPDHRAENVIFDHISALGGSFDFEVSLKPIEDSAEADFFKLQKNEDTFQAFLTIHGRDVPGVVRKFCSILGRELIDIVDFYAVGDKEQDKFWMAAELTIPRSTSYPELEKELQALAKEHALVTKLHAIAAPNNEAASNMTDAITTHPASNVHSIVTQLQKT